MAFTFFIHVFLGGPEIYTPSRAGGLDPVITSVNAVIWHFVSAVLAIMALALVWLAKAKNPALEWTLIAINVSTIALFIGYTLADFGALFVLPQWTLFTATLILMGLGQWRRG